MNTNWIIYSTRLNILCHWIYKFIKAALKYYQSFTHESIKTQKNKQFFIGQLTN